VAHLKRWAKKHRDRRRSPPSTLCDTYFFLAVLNARDRDHERALDYYSREDLERGGVYLS
jgi:hypothetical protein